MPRPKAEPKYYPADDIKRVAGQIINAVGWDHIDLDKVVFIRIANMKQGDNKAAMCRKIDMIYRHIFEKDLRYIIVILPEVYDVLSEPDKKRCILHELMHIPEDFSGNSLMGHDDFRGVDEIMKKVFGSEL